MRTLAMMLIFAAMLAPALAADEIRYRTGDKVNLATGSVTAWSWKEVSFRAGTNNLKVMRKDLIAVTRTSENGSLSANLSRAQTAINQGDNNRARTLLETEARSGDAVNKEEAMYLLADIALLEAGQDARRRQAAIDRYRTYLNAYKEGYFAQEAYLTCARLLGQAGDGAGARQTYRTMISVGAGLDLAGAQALGEFEFSAKQWAAAVAAFRDAARFAGADKSARYKSNAWQARALAANKDAAGARTLLEEIVKDEAFVSTETPDRDQVLAEAYAVLGQVYFEQKSYEQAYDANMMAAFYAWWLQGKGEADFLALAWRCAKKNSVGADQWKTRADKIEAVLSASNPKKMKEARDAEKDG